MFDIGWSELLLIGVVALIAIGPKELPGAIYQLGRWVRQARGLAREFQTHVDDLMHQAEIEELRKQAAKVTQVDLDRIVEDTVDPDRTLHTALPLPETGAAGSAGSPPEEEATTALPPPAPAEAVAEAIPPETPAPDKTA